MNSNEEINLFTDGAIGTITDNHRLEIESLKNKYENQIKRIKGLNEGYNKKLKYDYKSKIDKLTFELGIYKNENMLLKNQLSELQNEIVKKDFLIKELNEKLKIVNHKHNILSKNIKKSDSIIISLKKELNRIIKIGREAWKIFQYYAPEQYELYTRERKVKNNELIINKNDFFLQL